MHRCGVPKADRIYSCAQLVFILSSSEVKYMINYVI